MKKYYKLMTVGLVLIFISSLSGKMFADSNHADSNWHNEYRWNSPNDHTPSRPKYNKTAYYNYTSKIKGVSYINIWAAFSDGSKASIDFNGNDRVYSPKAGATTWLWNRAVEEQGSGVKVRIESQRWSDGSASGVWSPDSVR